MPMITCPECRKKISDSAGNCPNCGYKLTAEKIDEIKKKEKKVQSGCAIGCLSVIIIFVLIIVIASFLTNSHKNTSPKTKVETRKEQIEKNFSVWDGSHRGLTEYIKKSMNDPSSYKHIETTYSDKGDYLLVKTKFRGKNAFGGIVSNSVIAKVDLNGSVIEIISQGQ